jgi:hypothetical protein
LKDHLFYIFTACKKRILMEIRGWSFYNIPRIPKYFAFYKN